MGVKTVSIFHAHLLTHQFKIIMDFISFKRERFYGFKLDLEEMNEF